MGQCVHKNLRFVSVTDLLDIISPPNNEYSRFEIRRPFDEVYDNIILGGQFTAINLDELQRLGITHILNAAQGTDVLEHVNTNADAYKSEGIIFHGIPAINKKTFQIDKYFKEASNFIASAVGSKAIGKKEGKIYVHCRRGVSRSATLVIAYLVTCQEMNITDAVRTVRSKRRVSPNPGFLQQLIDYAAMLGRCH